MPIVLIFSYLETRKGITPAEPYQLKVDVCNDTYVLPTVNSGIKGDDGIVKVGIIGVNTPTGVVGIVRICRRVDGIASITVGGSRAEPEDVGVYMVHFPCGEVCQTDIGGNIKGLTTAAGIWMTAGIGLAIGAGMYIVTGCILVLIWLLQYVIYRIPLGADSYDGYHLRFVVEGTDDFETILRHQLKDWNAQITENTINWKRNDRVEFDCIVVRADEIKYSEIKKFVDENESIVSFSYSPVKRHFP